MRILPRRGIVVAAVDVGEQLRLLEVRREIERLIARAAARRADAAQRTQFREIAEGMERAAASEDETGFLRLDRALNLLVLEAARNEFATAAMALMHGLSRRFWFLHWREAAGFEQSAAVLGIDSRRVQQRNLDKVHAVAHGGRDRLLGPGLVPVHRPHRRVHTEAVHEVHS